MVVPAPDGILSPAGACCGEARRVDEVYRVGGAQAVARASPSAPRRSSRVAKIVGPGNAYVAAAKRLVFGTSAST